MGGYGSMNVRSCFVAAVAVASAAALVGALSAGLTFATAAPAAEPGAGVTFTSQSAVAGLVAHYTVSPAERPEDSSTSSVSDDRQLPLLTKHGMGTAAHRSAAGLSGAPPSHNTPPHP